MNEMKLKKMSCFSITVFLFATGFGSITHLSQGEIIGTTLYVVGGTLHGK
jgi:hypothetical protein